MLYGEEPVAEPTLESLQADVRALATAVAQLTARERVVDGEGAHGSGFGQRVAGQPTGSGGAAERPDLLELAQSGRVGTKSVSAEDDYLAYFTPYLARARNHAEAIDKAFRFRLAFLRRLNEIKRMHGDQGVLDVLRAQHFQPASEHLGSAIFGDLMRDYERRVFERPLPAARKRPLLLEWRLQLHVAGVDEDVAVDAGVAAKVSTSDDELGQRTLDLLSSSLSAQKLKSYAGRLSQFAEFCHDSENISPLEATTATVVRYVAWIGERGHIAAKSLQPYLSAINTFFELHKQPRPNRQGQPTPNFSKASTGPAIMPDVTKLDAKTLKSIACAAIICSTASVCLYLTATGYIGWSVAIEPPNTANGELGLYHYCPNTAFFLNETNVALFNISEVSTSCAYVDYNCMVALGTATPTLAGPIYSYRYYNIFDPRPYSSDDSMYQLIKVFPGPGSCSAYQNARVWAGLASFGAFFGFLTAPFGLCAPSRRRSGGSSGSGCVCCAVVCGIVSLCVWAASVINWSTSEYGSAYWCMLSAVVLGVASIPCLGVFALAPSSDPAYAHPPPNAAPVGGQYYGQYAAGQQYAYQPGQYPQGQYPPPQGQYYQQPPTGAPPHAGAPPPADQQYQPQP
eukprot:jgi/Tetstr1/454434/TSEL_041334.t1